MAGHARDLGLERVWRQRLGDWQRSGLNGRAFCRRHGLSEASFYSWRRIIARRDRQQLAARHQPAARPAFVPVHIVAAAPIEVIVRSGQTVRVGAGFDPAQLRAVVAALEGEPC